MKTLSPDIAWDMANKLFEQFRANPIGGFKRIKNQVRWSRKDLATTPVKIDFFQETGDWKSNIPRMESLGNIYKIITGVIVGIFDEDALVDHLEYAKILMNTYLSLDVGGINYIDKMPVHCLAVGAGLSVISNITPAATEAWAEAKSQPENIVGTMIPYAYDQVIKARLDVDTANLTSLTNAITVELLLSGWEFSLPTEG